MLKRKFKDDYCFRCGDKVAMSFDIPSLRLILDLQLCDHHRKLTEETIAKGERQPGEEG